MIDHTTYSFLDISGSMFHPKIGPYIFTGKGVGQLIIQPSGERTEHDYAADDGTVIITKLPSIGGKILIQCQQVSSVHSWLLWLYSVISSPLGDDNDWGRMVMLIRDVQHGTQYNIRGVSFSNIPETTYEAKGGNVTWTLMYAAMLVFPAHPTGAGQLSSIARRILGS